MKIDESIFELIVTELNGSISEENRITLNNWKLENEENNKHYVDLFQLWAESGQLNYLTHDQKLADWLQVKKTMVRPLRSIWYWSAAASVLLVLGFLSYYQFIADPYQDYVVHSADSEIIVIPLSDGSLIDLNKGSQLYISPGFNLEDRTVILKGEAYFHVAKNESLPFLIESGKSMTRVLGTTFNLLTKGKKTELTVTEGRVSFGTTAETITVVADQAAFLDPASGRAQLTQADFNVLSWKTGVLQFSNTKFDVVLKRIAKHYQISFDLQDKELREKVFTSKFDHSPLEEVISELELILELNIYEQDGIYIIKESSKN